MQKNLINFSVSICDSVWVHNLNYILNQGSPVITVQCFSAFACFIIIRRLGCVNVKLIRALQMQQCPPRALPLTGGSRLLRTVSPTDVLITLPPCLPCVQVFHRERHCRSGGEDGGSAEHTRRLRGPTLQQVESRLCFSSHGAGPRLFSCVSSRVTGARE